MVENLGQAGHAIEDFFSHSNYVDHCIAYTRASRRDPEKRTMPDSARSSTRRTGCTAKTKRSGSTSGRRGRRSRAVNLSLADPWSSDPNHYMRNHDAPDPNNPEPALAYRKAREGAVRERTDAALFDKAFQGRENAPLATQPLPATPVELPIIMAP